MHHYRNFDQPLRQKMRRSCKYDVIIAVTMMCVAIGVARAQTRQELPAQQPEHESSFEERIAGLQSAEAPQRCRLDMIWPPSDAIILLATDSLSVTAYFMLSGGCAEFLHPKSPASSQLRIGFVAYDEASYGRDSPLQRVHSLEPLPLDQDTTPSHFRRMRSPLLVSSNNESRPHTGGRHDAAKPFSIWFISLVYDTGMLNIQSVHDLESSFMHFEFHLISNFSTPAASLPAASATMRFRRLGKPTSYFFSVTPRYISIPGYVCMSACGTMCLQHTQTKRNEGEHSLLTTESPICSRMSQPSVWSLTGPSFTLHDPGADAPFAGNRQGEDVCTSHKGCIGNVGDIVFVSIGGASNDGHPIAREISVSGPGRHRLLSVIAAVLKDSVGFIFLKTWRMTADPALVTETIRQHHLRSSNAFIGVHKRRIHTNDDLPGGRNVSDQSYLLPTAEFGSIEDGILLSRAAAELILMAANDEVALSNNVTLPAACSEFLIFSDAWLGWCAAELRIPAIEMQFANAQSINFDSTECDASSSFYRSLVQLYIQQRVSTSNTTQPPFTERTTLGFRYFMRTLAFHLVTGPKILVIPDYEDQGSSMFWDVCSSRVLIDHMLDSESLSSHFGLHPLLQHLRDDLAHARSRNAFINILRAAIISKNVSGRKSVFSGMPAVRQRLRMSVSAMRVLGCSVQNKSSFIPEDGDLLTGTSVPISDPLELHAILPAVLLAKHSRLVSRALYLATQEEWARAFGYNPLYSVDASLAFAAPEFNAQDWHALCMLAVASLQGRALPVVEKLSREHTACRAFASAVLQRTYASGMPRCFDMPNKDAQQLLHSASETDHVEYLKKCNVTGNGEIEFDDDPYMLRPLAGQLQALLLERWDLQQSWFEASLQMHNPLVMRADEFVETLQWNLCRGTVASVTAFLEHDISVATFFRSLSVPIHDPEKKLHLQPIHGIYQFDTGFKLASDRFSGKLVIMMSADMLLGDERLWHNLPSTPNGTAAFFQGSNPRMMSLSRLELDDAISPCCTLNVELACHDAFLFRSPLLSSVRLDLFNYQQNIWRGEHYALGLLRSGGYELYNPCFSLPIFHNHISGQRPNQNENSIFEIRRLQNTFFASTCQPQLDLMEQCEEMFNCIDFVEFNEAHLCSNK